MSYLYLAIHYPKPAHRDDLLAAMRRLDEALQGAPGLLRIGAWRDEQDAQTGRIVALSLWASREAFVAAMGRFAAVVADAPFDEWEERPRELLRAEEVTVPT